MLSVGGGGGEGGWSNEEERHKEASVTVTIWVGRRSHGAVWASVQPALLMNLCGPCPGDELAAECELSPRGEGANKTQHNTNGPLSLREPTVKTRQDTQQPRIGNVDILNDQSLFFLTKTAVNRTAILVDAGLKSSLLSRLCVYARLLAHSSLAAPADQQMHS